MTVSMTQGVLNALHPKALKAWEAARARRQRREQGPSAQTQAQAAVALAQLQAAFPGNVKVH